MAHPAAIRVLDVTGFEERAERLTIVLEPIVAEQDRPPVNETELEAELEWGDVQASPHHAIIDIGRGVTFGLSASRLIGTVRNIGAGHAAPPPAMVRASAMLGGSSTGLPPLRAVRFGPLDPGTQVRGGRVPTFARRVSLNRIPQAAMRIEFFGGNGSAIAEARWGAGAEAAALVPPGADRFVITNSSRTAITQTRAVFELAL